MAALLPTLLGNTLLFYFCLKGWNLLTLAGFHPITETFSSLTPAQQVLMLAFPSLFLLARTGAMALLAKMQKKNGEDSSKEMENATVRADMNLRNSEGREQRVMVYRSWDTAWILAIILTLTIGFPFPVPGNLYIKGNDWKLEKEKNLLARMAIASLAAVALVCQLAPKGMPLLFGLSLLALDGFFFFYPFCGFNASRIKRMGAKTYGLSFAITLAVMLLLLVY